MATTAERIRSDMAAAMKSRDQQRRNTLRLLVSSLTNARIEAGHELSDEEALRVLQREAKQRRDSIEEYRKGGREDLATAEQAELEVINGYLPEQLSDDDLRAVVRQVVSETGASGPGDLGKVMGPVMQRIAGRADGRRANEIAREVLAG